MTFAGDDELLMDNGRPHVVLFACAIVTHVHRSAEVEPSASDSAGVIRPLPPGKRTTPKHRHGLHVQKMFPVTEECHQAIRVVGDACYRGLIKQTEKEESQIVQKAQAHLARYETGE